MTQEQLLEVTKQLQLHKYVTLYTHKKHDTKRTYRNKPAGSLLIGGSPDDYYIYDPAQSKMYKFANAFTYDNSQEGTQTLFCYTTDDVYRLTYSDKRQWK